MKADISGFQDNGCLFWIIHKESSIELNKQGYFPMYLSRILYATVLLLLLLPAFASAAQVLADSTPVTVKVDHDDGGKTGNRHMLDLLVALNQERCSAI